MELQLISREVLKLGPVMFLEGCEWSKDDSEQFVDERGEQIQMFSRRKLSAAEMSPYKMIQVSVFFAS